MQPPRLKVAVARKPTIQPLHLLFVVISTLILLLCMATAFAEDTSSSGGTNANPNQNPAYMWKDSQGVTTYGDQPDNPTTQQYNIDAAQPATQPNATQTTKTPTTTDTTSDKNLPKDDKAASKSALQDQQDQIDANCKKAQENIQTLQNTSRRIYVTDPNGGEPHYLTEDERQAQLDLAQKQASVYCDGNGDNSANGK